MQVILVKNLIFYGNPNMSKINSFTIWSFTMYHLVERAVSIQLSALRFYGCSTSLSPVAGTYSPALRVAFAVPV